MNEKIKAEIHRYERIVEWIVTIAIVNALISLGAAWLPSDSGPFVYLQTAVFAVSLLVIGVSAPILAVAYRKLTSLDRIG